MGNCSAAGVLTNPYNCIISATSGSSVKTIQITNVTGITYIIPIACANTSSGGTSVCVNMSSVNYTPPHITFDIFTQSGGISSGQGFNFVVYGN